MNKPLVSVYMTTYFHESYIKQAIDSVLLQKTTFPFEIVISDDFSGDATPAILMEYASTYDNIHINLNKQNMGLTANMFLAKSLCKGKYICDLSGDDYWIDEYKLQKQFEFLENNPEYYSVCTRIEMRPDFSEKYVHLIPDSEYVGKDFTLNMFVEGNNLPMNGIMMRNPFLTKEDKAFYSIMPQMSPYIDDLTDNILILKKGKSFVLPDHMVVYRIREEIKDDKNYGSINKKLSSYKKHIELLNNLYDYFGNEIDLFCRYKIVVFSGFKTAILCCKLKEFFIVLKTIPLEYKKRGIFARVLMMIPRKAIMKVKGK